MTDLRLSTFGLLTVFLMVLSFGSHSIETEEKLPKSDFKDIIWDDLLPPELELNALLNPPDPHALDFENKTDDGFAFQSPAMTAVVPELDGQAIRIPGFIVPLEFDDEQTITEFFLVPYFGACIHSPPPPPNQIIFVRDPEGFKLNDIYTPFWVSGVLSTAVVQNEMAASAYTINMQYLDEYTDW